MTKAIVEEQTEREKQKEKKRIQYNLKMDLKKHFYTYFKKYQGDTKNDIIDFYDIDIREKIIQQLGEDDGYKMTYLNSIYSKTLKEISQIFIDNDKFLKTQQPSLSFEQMCNVSIDMMRLYGKKPIKSKEQKQNNIITLLNLILSPWNK